MKIDLLNKKKKHFVLVDGQRAFDGTWKRVGTEVTLNWDPPVPENTEELEEMLISRIKSL